MTLFRRFGGLVAGSATAATLTLGLALLALQFSSPASARSESSSCADPVTSAPTGPATVSAAPTPFGRALVVGSGDHAGCSLYLLTSDQLHGLTSVRFACSDNANPTGAPCDTVLWPALLTHGAPIAGPGVNPTLLGTVTRDDMPFGGSVQQVTYAGQPLYRFFLDEEPGKPKGPTCSTRSPAQQAPGTWSTQVGAIQQQVRLTCNSKPLRSAPPGRTRPSWPQ